MPVFIPNNLAQTAASGNPSIDGLLWGWHWASTDWGYSFPADTSEYLVPTPAQYPSGYLGWGYEQIQGFQQFNALQQNQIVGAVGAVETFLPVTFVDNATVGQGAPVVFRFAEADLFDLGYGGDALGNQWSLRVPGLPPNGSAESIVPDPFQTNWRAGGDNWFKTGLYDIPIAGSFANAAGLLHEFGHSLGLKHGHHTQPIYNILRFHRDPRNLTIVAEWIRQDA